MWRLEVCNNASGSPSAEVQTLVWGRIGHVGQLHSYVTPTDQLFTVKYLHQHSADLSWFINKTSKQHQHQSTIRGLCLLFLSPVGRRERSFRLGEVLLRSHRLETICRCRSPGWCRPPPSAPWHTCSTGMDSCSAARWAATGYLQKDSTSVSISSACWQ